MVQSENKIVRSYIMKMQKNHKGITLIELLISIVIFGIISAGIMMTMSGSFRTTLVTRNVNEMTQNTNAIFELIKRDLELAGSFVLGGILIPNNNPQMIGGGFDNAGCRNNIPADIEVRDLNNNLLGVIPAGTDTIAVAFIRPAAELGIIGCDPNAGPIDHVEVTSAYSSGDSNLTVGDTSDFGCHLTNNAARPMFAVITDAVQSMLCEMFTISSVQANRINIANDAFSSGSLLNNFNAGSRVYLLGSRPNTGKIEYFILQSDQPNPRDPNTPLRSLVKRVNNREIYPVAENITNLQIRYHLTGSQVSNIVFGTIAGIQVDLTIRSDDMIRGGPDSVPDIDPVTLTDRARYFEHTYTTLIAVTGTIYKQAFDLRYYP